MPTVAPTKRAALDWRRRLDESIDLHQRVSYLGAMFGLRLGPGQLDEPLTAQQPERRPQPADGCRPQRFGP
ncbi:hypothetical protein AB0G04_10905 [Actinoplanes sp. NPDC023801]|uniref:hypothetical protein n=1 Tax=Actinoplanes sp. NPDC023801 TaxID=3154595 RepID=UPI003403DC18